MSSIQPALRAVLAAVLTFAAAAVPARAQDLDQTLDRVAAAWQRSDAAGVTSLAARAGLSLDLDGTTVGPLGPRQAAAGLRRVFDDRESVSVRTGMTRTVGGDPERAFGELVWDTRARGTTIPEREKVFVALVRENGTWRITEIRLLR